MRRCCESPRHTLEDSRLQMEPRRWAHAPPRRNTGLQRRSMLRWHHAVEKQRAGKAAEDRRNSRRYAHAAPVAARSGEFAEDDRSSPRRHPSESASREPVRHGSRRDPSRGGTRVPRRLPAGTHTTLSSPDRLAPSSRAGFLRSSSRPCGHTLGSNVQENSVGDDRTLCQGRDAPLRDDQGQGRS
jgi:hypothetical protein